MTYTAPPAFLAAIPDRLLVRRPNAGADLRRANQLVRFIERSEYRPSFLDIEAERRRR